MSGGRSHGVLGGSSEALGGADKASSRRGGKMYMHTHDGMRKFVEDRLRSSGWGTHIMRLDNAGERESLRCKICNLLTEEYIEAYIATRSCYGRGRPNVRNLNEAKMNVKKISEDELRKLEMHTIRVTCKKMITKWRTFATELENLPEIKPFDIKIPPMK